jgi:hypothetical protein
VYVCVCARVCVFVRACVLLEVSGWRYLGAHVHAIASNFR